MSATLTCRLGANTELNVPASQAGGSTPMETFLESPYSKASRPSLRVFAPTIRAVFSSRGTRSSPWAWAGAPEVRVAVTTATPITPSRRLITGASLPDGGAGGRLAEDLQVGQGPAHPEELLGRAVPAEVSEPAPAAPGLDPVALPSRRLGTEEEVDRAIGVGGRVLLAADGGLQGVGVDHRAGEVVVDRHRPVLLDRHRGGDPQAVGPSTVEPAAFAVAGGGHVLAARAHHRF